ncbi:hypothetical protein ACSMFR_05110 [Listeria aquatica]|uniref:hypothetical protein n=1 Tax=Listeria aquatica TaxID=1494960 RepID=UPI003F70BEB9
MKYKATIISENPDIEEELKIRIKDIELLCFVEEYRCPAEVGKEYIIDLEIVIFDDLNIEKNPAKTKEIIQQGDSFSYCIKGVFYPSDKKIDSGIDIDLADEDISDFWYLENQFVMLSIDRFNINVVEEIKK